MERVLIVLKREYAPQETINLRFRLRDGRETDLFHKSDISTTWKNLEELLKKVNSSFMLNDSVRIYNKELLERIQAERNKMIEAYHQLKEEGGKITSARFEDRLNGRTSEEGKAESWVQMFQKYNQDKFNAGTMGEARLKHAKVVESILKRFLIVNGLEDITPDMVTASNIMKLRTFAFDEYKIAAQKKYAHLYEGMKKRNIPTDRRKNTTVATLMSHINAFFNKMENADIISKSPFRKLGKTEREDVMRERYDEPYYLKAEEFEIIRNTPAPERLEETKKAFILQCALGCRISDFVSIRKENVSVSPGGIPYVHYLPKKTSKISNKEIETPLVKFAFEILKERNFCVDFAPLKYVFGKSGYNKQIKELLAYCGIDRKCTVLDEATNRNTYIPIHELASSKLCRKTFVDMMHKVQLNKYASGLHREGSKAVEHYTSLELYDRFILMCAAFGEQVYKVEDTQL